MLIQNLGEISAIGFDIDGTLYKNWRLNIRVFPHVLRHLVFFQGYSKTRKILHNNENYSDFKLAQNTTLGKFLHCSPEKAEFLQEKFVYGGLARHFLKIKPCDGVVQLIKDLKAAGYKIAMLSDFPPEQKGDIWGIKPFCDVILETGACGALKPSTLPFQKMAEALETAPENILYVGNSLSKDVDGASRSGMKSAWFAPKHKCKGKKGKKADIAFWDYEQLRAILLPNTK